MVQLSKAAFPEFGQQVTVVTRGAHYGDGRWLELKVETKEALQQLIKQCADHDVGVIMGKRRELPPSFDKDRLLVFVDHSACRRVIEHVPEDQVITVETGLRLRDLNELLKKHDQYFPIVSGRQDASLLELIECGDGGVLEHGFGGPRDLVLGLEVLLAGGSSIKCGGKVVKNVTGYDLTKLFVGSRGSLGVAAVAHLRLFARPKESAVLLLTTRKLSELIDQVNNMMVLGLPLASVEIVDARLLARLIHLLDADDKCGLMNSSITGGDVYYALIVQIAGPAGAVEETLPQLKNLPFGKSLVTMPPFFEEQILPACSDLGQICKLSPIDFSLSVHDMQVLVRNWWQRVGHLPIQLRLSAGRMRLFSESVPATKRVLDSMAKRSRDLNEPPVVSCPGAEHEFRIIRYDDGLSSGQSIARELKNRFDPGGCMNPLVNMV